MRQPAVRLAVGLLGLAVAVYGMASLTGGWLGTLPWWEREVSQQEFWEIERNVYRSHGWSPIQRNDENKAKLAALKAAFVSAEAQSGREWISGGVVAVGLALVAFAAWPRRSTPRPPVEA